MSPEQRKEASELLLHKRGIRLNLQLHVIESDDEVTLRGDEDIVQRLVALWLVSSAARARDVQSARAYVEQHGVQHWLSAQEAAFIFGDAINEEEAQRLATRAEAFYFLGWCAGLVEKIVIPTKASKLSALEAHFLNPQQSPLALQSILRTRRKAQMLDWSDLLYRLHWAVRHAHLTGRPTPASLNADAVREWHQVANWICRYEDGDDWDKVSTET